MRIRPVALAIAIFGQALIILAFVLLLPMFLVMSTEVMILDMVVASLIYWLFAWNLGMAPIRLDDPSGKQAAGLGIRWTSTTWYSILAIIVMVAMFFLPFVWQLMAQLVLLFGFAIALFASSAATRTAGNVYRREQFAMAGKKDVRFALNDLVDNADLTPGVPDDIKRRLRALADGCRYLTPSTSPEAINYEQYIIDDASRLREMLPQWQSYGQQASQLLSRVEQTMRRRRESMS